MSKNKVEGVLAEFKNPAELLNAATRLREAGYKDFDCHSPFPIHGMDQAMGEKRSSLAWIVGPVGFVALVSMFAFEGWTSSIAYPIVISGKPFFSYQAYGVAAFAVMVLTSALLSFIGMLAINKLPRYHHPVFHSDNFAKVTDDGFFVSIEASDPKFEEKETARFLESIGGSNVELLIDQE